jgi:hypothetical protein
MLLLLSPAETFPWRSAKKKSRRKAVHGLPIGVALVSQRQQANKGKRPTTAPWATSAVV